MEWIKVEDRLPDTDDDVCILIYENWSRRRNGKLNTYAMKEDESWHVCGGSYDKYEYYLPCKPGVEGGFGNIYNDYDEGQLIYVVAWCPMPRIKEMR